EVIIQKGDLVKIDMRAKSVVINEEPGLSKKSFGSNYFNIATGYSELIIQPENTFDTKVKWQDRYL
ncbi:phage distal tail protein, partial [Staphylococcus aureus]